MRKQWVIPDIHGYINTLKCLVEERIKPSREDELYFLGDYIDRGPDARGVIDYIRGLQNDGYSITPLKGNHENFMVELYDAELRPETSWLFNFNKSKRQAWDKVGGKATLESFGVSGLKEVPPDYVEWMRDLTYYIELDDFVLVHAGLNFMKMDPFSDKEAMLWSRDYEIIPRKIGNRRIIHGHTPQSMDQIMHSYHDKSLPAFDIDNGPYLNGFPGFGSLVALELTEMELVIQENRDT